MGSLNRGGAEVLLLDVCKRANSNELEIILIHRKGGQLLESFQQTEVLLLRLSPSSFTPLAYLRNLRKLLRTHNIEVVHTHQTLDAVLACLATWGLSVPVVLTLHGHGLAASSFSRVLRYCALQWSSLVVFVSQAQQQHYLKRYSFLRAGEVLPNGIDFGKNTPTSNALSFRNTLPIVPPELLLGSVGNFTSGRDQLTICKFLTLLKAKEVPFKFVFVGAPSAAEPERYSECVSYCESHGLADQVSFLGSRSDVPLLLRQLDAFIYSTVHDTFGIALIEAIASGIPVFVNDWEVMREVTNQGAWATLYASRNPADLLAKFLDFYTHQETYRKHALLHAEQVREQYSIEKHLTRLRFIYEQLLTNAKPT